jgi:glutamine synthetase
MPRVDDVRMSSLSSADDVRATAAELERQGVKAIRLLYADLHGVARGKNIPIAAFGDQAEHGVAFCAAVLATDLRQTPVVDDEREGYHDLVARPDTETLRVVPWEPEVAWCVADLWRPGAPERWPGCPRGALAAVTERFAELGLAPLVGPELEFFLMERDASAPGGYRRYVDEDSRSYTVGYVSDPRGVVLDMLASCERLGLQALSANHEFSNSQYEITVGHSRAVDAADRGFLLRAAVKEMAVRAGLVATFMGKPFNDQGGSGFHVHLSLTDADGQNAFADDDRPGGLSELHASFLAGVLEHAPALTAVLAPTVNAYKRMVRESLVPTHANWGHDNRTAYVRVPPERGAGARIEVRAGDGSANAHLIVAALLAAGLDGVRRGLEPPPPVEGNAYRAAGAGTPLPRSLGAALDLLAADSVLVDALGAELVETFVRMKRFEVERFSEWVTDWELDEYAHHL